MTPGRRYKLKQIVGVTPGRRYKLKQRSNAKLKHEAWNLEKAWPKAHAMMDKFRHVAYRIKRVIQSEKKFDPTKKRVKK